MYDPEIEIIERREAPVPRNAELIKLRLNGDVFTAILSHDEYGKRMPPDMRWHISVSREDDMRAGNDDVPVWRDFVAIVHHLRPGVPFVIGIPPRNQWMNANPNVLHVYETRDVPMIENWKANAGAVKGTRAAEPS